MQTLEKKLNHKNISILRHPNYFIFYWSHHEKIVLVDQKIGFLGGIDLCPGRYDTQKHPIFDPEGKFYPGIDYSNPYLTDFGNIQKVYKTNLDR
jgi:phospholipase D1/2